MYILGTTTPVFIRGSPSARSFLDLQPFSGGFPVIYCSIIHLYIGRRKICFFIVPFFNVCPSATPPPTSAIPTKRFPSIKCLF